MNKNKIVFDLWDPFEMLSFKQLINKNVASHSLNRTTHSESKALSMLV